MYTRTFNNKRIRFHINWGLVLSFLVFSCSENRKEGRLVAIQWEGRRAESIIIPRELLSGTPIDSISQLLHIQLVNSSTPILGEYIITHEAVVFRPLIAFTRGLKYELRLVNELVGEVEVPPNDPADAPVVTSVYPTGDMLPLNLLKIYIAFSKPMQEGQAVKNIAVIKNRHDTVSSIFLDLQPELWNKERTMLTLWLDPGRIKRNLQPNKKMGSPLQQGSSFQIVIKKDWPDAEGVSLAYEYHKDFIAGLRDSLSPDPSLWTFLSPKAGSSEPLRIDLHESLDYVLLKNAVRILDHQGKVLNGVAGTESKETILIFTPSVPWNPGDYIVEIESRLEDLAGNNLDRLFDKDLSRQSTGGQKGTFKRTFHIQ